MVRKKIDNRVRVLIENGVARRHRSFFVIVGKRARDQVNILHHMLSKAQVRARPNVLWCYKRELGFNAHRKKKMKRIKKAAASGTLDIDEDDTFGTFIASTNIRFCYYNETHKILGNTFGMCVLQDFSAITPNLLARTIETVEGGGVVAILLQEVDSLKQLYTLAMDVHDRFRTESHSEVVARFNERFILSLTSCSTCMVVDDQLNVLPSSSAVLNIEKEEIESAEDSELDELKLSMAETQPVGSLITLCKTLDQAEALLKFIDVISEKTLRFTVSLTAARGRGKSAALGLAIAAAIEFGYSNIFVTAPSPENVKTLFQFIYKGFDALKFEEHTDYSLVQSSNPNFNKAVIRVNVFREHRQTIQYIKPTDAAMLGQAELLVVDEAASIALPVVKSLFGPYLVFLSSTISGYEGTGRSLSLKLLAQLRQQSSLVGPDTEASKVAESVSRSLSEVTLKESIRYGSGDPVEQWLYNLLCLDCDTVPRVMGGCPLPDSCNLFYVNRDTLFSYHSASEEFLRRVMSIYVSAHYKNSPNDLQLLSDAPAHHVFVLLPPVDITNNALPEILVVIQIALEGEIPETEVDKQLSRGKRAAGDLIPWTVSQQFQDSNFASLAGARIVRIATHPEYQRMGFGLKALELLEKYFGGEFVSLDETAAKDSVSPKTKLPPLLSKLEERPCEKLDYIGVSFGLTSELFRFWKKRGMLPLYVRQTSNELTGEYTCIMAKPLQSSSQTEWCRQFNRDFQRRFVSLLSFEFRSFTPQLALNVLYQKGDSCEHDLTSDKLAYFFTPYDLKRLELYSKNMADYHLILDLVTVLARLYFNHEMKVALSGIQATILLSVGLQNRSIDDTAAQIQLPATQVLAVFCKIISKFSAAFSQILSEKYGAALDAAQRSTAVVVEEMEPTDQTLEQDLTEAGNEISEKWRQETNELRMSENKIRKFEKKVETGDWSTALEVSRVKGSLDSISVPRTKRTSDIDVKTPPAKFAKQKPGKSGGVKKKKFSKN